MKKSWLLLLAAFCAFLGFSNLTAAEEKAKDETIRRNGYSLKLTIKDATFPDKLKQRMIDTFFVVYPKMSADFNKKSPKEVKFVIEKMDGVAYASGGEIHFSADWMKNAQGNDIDVITHETMHLVQSYSNGNPGWVTEGIADYARLKYGVDNKGSGWDVPAYAKDQKYTDAYRVTARFFMWIENRVNKDAIRKLDGIMRDGKYGKDTWKQLTGKTVDELWDAYGKDSQLTGPEPKFAPPPRTEEIKKNGYTLKFIIQDPAFTDAVKQKMADTFFTVYPKLQEKFNPQSAKEVTFIIREMDGVAHTFMHNANVHYSSKWMMNRKGNDIDVVTHELTHVVQAYPNKRGVVRPGWVTEGLADYARYQFGVDNKGSGWALPNYSERNKYTDAYRVTGRFFAWLEQNTNKDILSKLDATMRNGTYTDEFWKEQTKKTIDELWADYAKNPALT